jgi:hypothetical protein
MNSNDKITIDIKDLKPFKKIEFKENPSSKILILFGLIISSIFLLTIIILILNCLIEIIKSKSINLIQIRF